IGRVLGKYYKGAVGSLAFSILQLRMFPPMAILIPTVGKVRETARRTVDSSDVRQIVQASLLYAAEHDGRLPGLSIARDGSAEGTRELATIHLVAAALARDGGLNDTSVWFSAEDRAAALAPAAAIAAPVMFDDGTLNTDFLQEKALAWDYVTGLHTSHPITTPVAWTRGLRRDGTWDRRGVYGADGGYIAFLGGNVQFFKNLHDTPLVTPGGERTSDILKALPAGRRIVGSGPATLGGTESDSP
ncbi:MAG: hypothetical protein IAE82_16490, partial [Opitutaceae bacterium]|nr:hypothetical protein [Opitutaceae bacterium]